MRKIPDSFLRAVRRKVGILSFFIIVIIISFAFFIKITNNNNYEKSVLVNVFGRQRMLTQMMAKDANRILSLMQVIKTGSMVETDEVNYMKIADTKEALTKSKDEFDRVVQGLLLGSLQQKDRSIDFRHSQKDMGTYLEDLTNTWTSFKSMIDIILHHDKDDMEVREAVIFINANNIKLMDSSDAITQIILNAIKRKSEKYILSSYFLVILALVIISISLFSLYRYMVLPLNELYIGISQAGITRSKALRQIPTGKDMKEVIYSIDEAFDKIRKLTSLIENMNKKVSFDGVLDFIYKTFSTFIPYSYIGIALIKDDGKSLEASYGISDEQINGLPQGLMGARYSIETTSLGPILESGEARIINDYEEYVKGKEIQDYTRVILDSGIKSSITLPLIVNDRALGMIFFSSLRKGVYNKSHIEVLKTMANSIAISFEKSIFVDDLLYSGTLALARLAEARDEDTGDHLERMKVYARTIAQLLYEDSKYKDMISVRCIEDLEKFSPLHDIGKVGIRDSILLKPGKLTKEEFEEMKYHAEYGANVLRAAEENMLQSGRSLFKMGIEIAESHHEKWDGSGYPKGLKGEEIPLSARIVAVADVFDALTSKRPYKRAFSFEESMEIMRQENGTHFDPEILRVFLQNETVIYNIYNTMI